MKTTHEYGRGGNPTKESFLGFEKHSSVLMTAWAKKSLSSLCFLYLFSVLRCIGSHHSWVTAAAAAARAAARKQSAKPLLCIFFSPVTVTPISFLNSFIAGYIRYDEFYKSPCQMQDKWMPFKEPCISYDFLFILCILMFIDFLFC